MNIKLKDLVGSHIFTGFDYCNGNSSEQNSVLFVLDGVTYKAFEDPDDGYRSSLDSVIKTDEKCRNIFSPHFVDARDISISELIDFVDVITGDVVMSIGTDHSDNYYPICIMSFNPVLLAINKEPIKYKQYMRKYKLIRVLKN